MTVELERFKERLQTEPLTFAVLGPIGVGKTTFSVALGEKLGVPVFEERFMENNFLPRFYENPPEFSFRTQLKFLINTSDQLMEEKQKPAKSIIRDAGNEMNGIYARTHHAVGWMGHAELKEYEILFKIFNDRVSIKPPDLYFLLDAGLPKLRERIVERGRPFEMKILSDYPFYLSELRKAVRNFASSQKEANVIYVNANKDNFVDEIHINGLIEKIKRNI
jgi:deoxyadenosine/deoxycytidine kinase